MSASLSLHKASLVGLEIYSALFLALRQLDNLVV